MTKVESDALTLNLKTGWLCLDFANTAEWHASDHPEEHLNTYADLVAWARRVGILTTDQARRLLNKADRHRADAAITLERTIALREAIYHIFSAVAQDLPPKESDLAILNTGASEMLAKSRIVPTSDGFKWGWDGDEDALDRMLWPVVRSTVDLLTSKELRRVGECEDDRGCGWLFLDMSRNRSRRWCFMKNCGNRAKVRRYYERQRAAR